MILCGLGVSIEFGHQWHEHWTNARSVDQIRVQLEESLKALRMGQIDLYQFHSGSDEAFHNDELWTCWTNRCKPVDFAISVYLLEASNEQGYRVEREGYSGGV
ncbi:hypothetical protein [Paenibacillus illinoisensis]|uniref:Reductase n=1 Tax=Paenibacillus illinoisensis TaxID=59845 RepID=A0A2W0C6K5_9BACL|nr:Reductase [Paenibacillus illinoisensis]